MPLEQRCLEWTPPLPDGYRQIHQGSDVATLGGLMGILAMATAKLTMAIIQVKGISWPGFPELHTNHIQQWWEAQ